ncbi:protein of unknown function [Legionella pneumophila subsp. pneumophila]|nr:protein of unknown function [Legionella pneumophila subsp. pneumophila]
MLLFADKYKLARLERWPSGRRRTPGKCVYGNVSRVRIPLSPPNYNSWLSFTGYKAIIAAFIELHKAVNYIHCVKTTAGSYKILLVKLLSEPTNSIRDMKDENEITTNCNRNFIINQRIC